MTVTAEARQLAEVGTTSEAGATAETGATAEAGKAGAVRPTRITRLADIRAAGLVRQASERAAGEVERSLPVAAELRPLLPGGHLRRGGTVSVLGGPGTTSLLLALLARASATGSWCAAVGMPRLGLVAAAEAGVAVDRLALVPYPGPEWASVVAALLDGVDIVVTTPPGPVSPQVANRLVARARQRGAVLISLGQWPAAEVALHVVGATWHGLRSGRGRLRSRQLTVVAEGRGAAARARRVQLWLPGTPDAADSGVWLPTGSLSALPAGSLPAGSLPAGSLPAGSLPGGDSAGGLRRLVAA